MNKRESKPYWKEESTQQREENPSGQQQRQDWTFSRAPGASSQNLISGKEPEGISRGRGTGTETRRRKR